MEILFLLALWIFIEIVPLTLKLIYKITIVTILAWILAKLYTHENE